MSSRHTSDINDIRYQSNAVGLYSMIKKNVWWMNVVAIAAALSFGAIFIDPYIAYLATSWVAFGILGLSLNILWGRGGILSLGQTAFYGLGGYIGSIAAINFAELTGNTLIWSLPFGALAGVIAAGLIGFVIFYGRLGDLQTTILTYTFTLILWTIAIAFSLNVGDAYVGGDNGMSDIPGMVLGFGENAEALEEKGMFLVALVVCAVIYIFASAVMRSPFGLVIDCIRMDALKAELIGYDVRRYQLILFVMAGGIAGLAGALYASWSNYLSPSVFSVPEALLIPIYVLVGGKARLFGPFIGVLLVGGLSFWLGGGAAGGQTTLILGLVLIALVLFFERGLVGIFADLWKKIRPAKNDNTASNLSAPDSQVNINTQVLTDIRKGCLSSTRGFSTRKITKSFGGVKPVNLVSLEYQHGEVQCLVGPNGAGKSTFLRCCTGTHKISEGDIFYGKQNISDWEPFKRVQAGIGIKMQVAQIFNELTVRQNLWVAAYSRSGSKKAADRTADKTLRLLGKKSYGDKNAGELSHGNQQWLDIAMVLCLKPSVIFLDEPAAGMTKEETHQLSVLITELKASATVIVIEHDMEFIRSLNGKVTVLHQGEVFAQGTMEELKQNERVLDIYLGRKS
ncbi:MAG: ABC transporter permease subunit [Arenicella sp.]